LVIAFGVLLVAIYGLFIAVPQGISDWKRAEASLGWPTVTAAIVKSEVRRNQYADSADIQYEYSVSGKVYKSKRISFEMVHFSDWVRRFPKGLSAQASYDPNDPGEAVLVPGRNPWILFWPIVWSSIMLVACYRLLKLGPKAIFAYFFKGSTVQKIASVFLIVTYTLAAALLFYGSYLQSSIDAMVSRKDFDAAVSCARKKAKLEESLHGSQSEATSEALGQVAVLLWKDNRMADAKDAFREALKAGSLDSNCPEPIIRSEVQGVISNYEDFLRSTGDSSELANWQNWTREGEAKGREQGLFQLGEKPAEFDLYWVLFSVVYSLPLGLLAWGFLTGYGDWNIVARILAGFVGLFLLICSTVLLWGSFIRTIWAIEAPGKQQPLTLFVSGRFGEPVVHCSKLNAVAVNETWFGKKGDMDRCYQVRLDTDHGSFNTIDIPSGEIKFLDDLTAALKDRYGAKVLKTKSFPLTVGGGSMPADEWGVLPQNKQ
jgi:hypothetical protein